VQKDQVTRIGWLAVGLAVLGSLIAIVNEIMGYQRTGAVDYGHVALIIGVPASMYAIVASTSRKQ
jgi:hypothetical protein